MGYRLGWCSLHYLAAFVGSLSVERVQLQADDICTRFEE